MVDPHQKKSIEPPPLGEIAFKRDKIKSASLMFSALFNQLISQMKKVFPLVMLVALTGCASVTGSKLQPLSVQTIQDGKEVA
ncbi:MAG TPA: hypothetical protein VIM63_10170, partial [Rhodoferax sp.]